MTGLCANSLVTDEDTELAVKLCNSFGKTEIIPENLMDVLPKLLPSFTASSVSSSVTRLFAQDVYKRQVLYLLHNSVLLLHTVHILPKSGIVPSVLYYDLH